ncbi:membrane-bound lytic murein transglycosylase A [Desulfuromusa kysingii]|uniref:peptidoglycan lytic exotransglycosylase n=1 Tax=Desulfuromusa kysingii TaxID=37625 RepID=A0A1H3W0C0_9BACT|nr:murein transglycosylase A [Desulfuromusa kysingii]SDZ80585.1 membrane-bound lytic murein transglycosylase A [Desulfuromusa kysingii]
MRYYLLSLLIIVTLAGCMGKPAVQVPPAPEIEFEPLKPVSWEQVDGWLLDRPAAALVAFQQSCKAIGKRDMWQQVCAEAIKISTPGEKNSRDFFELYFQPYQVRNADGSDDGIITGYYGPELEGSRTPTEEYRYPLYRLPDDMLIVDLDEVYPELSKYRLRGRVVGNRVVPYFDRSEIDAGNDPLAGQELFWVKDPVDLFFLHIQGSGRIRLPDGELVMVNYANQNGHPYRSIGKLLLERNAMTRDQMSMQNIRSWVAENPEAGKQLLAENPSYVFFRELSAEFQSPPGALGVPLTALRSLAVDPRTIPLGAPVFLSTTFPGTDFPLKQLMVAQDTGGAIKGEVRADFFWGMGNDAGEIAGRMKQDGRLWVLLPKEELQQSRSESAALDNGIIN